MGDQEAPILSDEAPACNTIATSRPFLRLPLQCWYGDELRNAAQSCERSPSSAMSSVYIRNRDDAGLAERSAPHTRTTWPCHACLSCMAMTRQLSAPSACARRAPPGAHAALLPTDA